MPIDYSRFDAVDYDSDDMACGEPETQGGAPAACSADSYLKDVLGLHGALRGGGGRGRRRPRRPAARRARGDDAVARQGRALRGGPQPVRFGAVRGDGHARTPRARSAARVRARVRGARRAQTGPEHHVSRRGVSSRHVLLLRARDPREGRPHRADGRARAEETFPARPDEAPASRARLARRAPRRLWNRGRGQRRE